MALVASDEMKKAGWAARSWRGLRAFHFGEATLWLMFGFLTLGAMSDTNDTAATLAGICALAAIGVRATRPDREDGSHGEE
ncbi:MAG: hypothetical protein Q8N10_15440 [Phenylobacterium sp.]|nr:hypothetical protein [Phenylobacterium sp.]